MNNTFAVSSYVTEDAALQGRVCAFFHAFVGYLHEYAPDTTEEVLHDCLVDVRYPYEANNPSFGSVSMAKGMGQEVRPAEVRLGLFVFEETEDGYPVLHFKFIYVDDRFKERHNGDGRIVIFDEEHPNGMYRAMARKLMADLACLYNTGKLKTPMQAETTTPILSH